MSLWAGAVKIRINMNITRYSVAALVAALVAGTASVRANTSFAVQSTPDYAAVPGEFQPVDFEHEHHTEAEMMLAAYSILAKGDHDYNGHRRAAMANVKRAAEMLGYNLGGDEKFRERQALSDERLREARTLLARVLRVSAVKDQEKIAKRLMEAIVQIDDALAQK